MSDKEEKHLTKKQFDEYSKKYKVIFIGDECNSLGHYWEIMGFAEVEGEYHKRVK